MIEHKSRLKTCSKPCGPNLYKSITEVVTHLLSMALAMTLLLWGQSDLWEYWSQLWSRREIVGVIAEAREEEWPSMWSSRSARNSPAVSMVRERDTFGLLLVCGSRVLSWRLLLFCIYRSVLVAQLHGLGARSTAVLALHSVPALGGLLNVCRHCR